MGRLVLCLVWAMLMPMRAVADYQPAEEPPKDFPGSQYIDTKGCVFRKSESGAWDPRLGSDGKLTCGYPPSASIRGLNGKPRLRVLDPNAGKSQGQLIEEALATTVFTALEPGELVSDREPLQKLPDMGPEPAPTGPLDELKAELRAAPAVKRAMGMDVNPNPRLCQLLGHNGAQVPPGLGRDPTSGYCDALTPLNLAHLVFVRPVTVTPAVVPASVEKPLVIGTCRDRNAKGCKAVHSGKTRKAVTPSVPRRGLASSARPSNTIPADARHVELGRFKNPKSVERLAKKARRVGYPLLRGRVPGDDSGEMLLLAGPFTTRGEIAQALVRFRNAGFPGVVAR